MLVFRHICKGQSLPIVGVDVVEDLTEPLEMFLRIDHTIFLIDAGIAGNLLTNVGNMRATAANLGDNMEELKQEIAVFKTE
jgi:hypothetical protein